MSTFDDRQKGFENKFKHDQELQFKVMARRNKLLGLWAAGKLGRADAEAYAKEVVASDFEKAGDSDVVEKILKDAKAKGVAMSEAELRAQMDHLLPVAKKQIMEQAIPFRALRFFDFFFAPPNTRRKIVSTCLVW